MQIQHTDSGQSGKFYIEQNGTELAELTYIWHGTEQIAINHTGVREALQGQGIAKQLLIQAIEFDRARQIKIVPLCSYAHKVMTHGTQYQDVLA